MEKMKILWADDEIDLLKPHIIFLEDKGYEVLTANNGEDAIEFLEHEKVDLIFLDENMPGITGLEALTRIKADYPSIPVIMITKSEEESIMEEAIGSKISDYLIKPVNPNQILLSVKKNLDSSRLVSEKTSADYRQEFQSLSMDIHAARDFGDWENIYKKLVHWDIELEGLGDPSMFEILQMQKTEANKEFARFIERNYSSWLNSSDGPTMSHHLFRERVFPNVKSGSPLYVLMIDNLRLDQWKVIENKIQSHFRSIDDDLYLSILPTATSFSRNAIFSGSLPSELEDALGDIWFLEDEIHIEEKILLEFLIKKEGLDHSFGVVKATNIEEGKKLSESVVQMRNNDLNVVMYNFVDMISHSKTEVEMIKELADDEAAFRSLTLSWFEHSPLYDALKKIAEIGGRLMVTSDHGSIRVKDPVKVIGDKSTNTNLRYKQGKNLNYPSKDVIEFTRPEDIFLPKPNVSTRYIFSSGEQYFVYPNNYNHFVQYYKNTFQHGGVSMEEMMVPVAYFEPK